MLVIYSVTATGSAPVHMPLCQSTTITTTATTAQSHLFFKCFIQYLGVFVCELCDQIQQLINCVPSISAHHPLHRPIRHTTAPPQPQHTISTAPQQRQRLILRDTSASMSAWPRLIVSIVWDAVVLSLLLVVAGKAMSRWERRGGLTLLLLVSCICLCQCAEWDCDGGEIVMAASAGGY